MQRHSRTLLTGLVLALALACSDGTGPNNTRPPGELNILRFAQGVPPLAATSVSFYAVYGDEREGKIEVAGNQGAEEFLKFKVGDFSLLRSPAGQLYGPGDSVLITISVVSPDSFYFEFQPAGLVFNPADLPELELHYNYAGTQLPGDLDGDGDVDAEDEEIETTLDLWIQAAPGDPFRRLQVLVEIELDEIEAKIPHFSRFALAY